MGAGWHHGLMTPQQRTALMLHGFTGTPGSIEPWARRFRQQGWSVCTPTLAGHGTTWQEMGRTTWPEWLHGPEEDLKRLARDTGGPIVVAGLSMGGTTALALAERHPDLVAAVLLVNPALGVKSPVARFAFWLQHIVPSVPSIASDIRKPGVREPAYPRVPVASVAELNGYTAHVRARLDRIRCPIWLATSTVDHLVAISDSDDIESSAVNAAGITRVTAENSWHVATLDHDADMIAEESERFAARTLERLRNPSVRLR